MTRRPGGVRDGGRPRWIGVALAVAAIVGACAGGPVLANAPAVRPSPSATPVPSPRPPDPIPIVFPRDDAPHDRLTEWWYYTGHLRDVATGDRYGFEYVIFRAERGDFPVSWASHLAVTDEAHDRFLFSQRTEIGPQGDLRPSAGGFDLALVPDPGRPPDASNPPWRMTGSGGTDRLVATTTTAEATASGSAGALGLDLRLTAQKAPALHDRDGWIDFGPGGGSYYYSRTRMAAAGTVTLDGRTLTVEGAAWFDHQWGDFIAVGGGGWDWFAVNLADGTDLTLSLVRDRTGADSLVYGTVVAADGSTTHLPADAFHVTVTGHWTSPRTGAVYPAGWHVEVPSQGLAIDLAPTVAGQELDTRPTTGVVYWEGSQVVHATRHGTPLSGEAYVELTGYAPTP
ncbi:MAG TPA: lipocalin family protein [Candidatus Limnocylindrales bacterium]